MHIYMYVFMYVCIYVSICMMQNQMCLQTINFIGRCGNATMCANNGFSFRISNIANDSISKLYLREQIFNDSKSMQIRCHIFFLTNVNKILMYKKL